MGATLTSDQTNTAPPDTVVTPGRRHSTGVVIGAVLVGVALGAIAAFAIIGYTLKVRVELPPPPYPQLSQTPPVSSPHRSPLRQRPFRRPRRLPYRCRPCRPGPTRWVRQHRSQRGPRRRARRLRPRNRRHHLRRGDGRRHVAEHPDCPHGRDAHQDHSPHGNLGDWATLVVTNFLQIHFKFSPYRRKYRQPTMWGAI
jgi:hypothetical protein